MNNLITPPVELVQQWADMLSSRSDYAVFSLATQWGADQELDACCEWLVRNYNYPEAGNPLRTARRPKPPSLKEQALNLLNNHNNGWTPSPKQWQTIRIAVEALPNDC